MLAYFINEDLVLFLRVFELHRQHPDLTQFLTRPRHELLHRSRKPVAPLDRHYFRAASASLLVAEVVCHEAERQTRCDGQSTHVLDNNFELVALQSCKTSYVTYVEFGLSKMLRCDFTFTKSVR